jgi:enoyl-CoA hydratase/carnithine racemase
MGLVDHVVPAQQLMAEAKGLASTLLKGAPNAVRQTKRLLCELHGPNLAQLLSHALEYHKQARRSDEAREGLAAFRERREPRWSDSIE